MSDNKILEDHKKIKNKLVAPFNYKVTGLHEVSWVNTIIPELLWIALLIKHCGDKEGIETALEVSKLATEIKCIEKLSFFGTMSSFKLLDDSSREEILNNLSSNSYRLLNDALAPLAEVYPEHSLMFLMKEKRCQSKSEYIENLSSVVSDIFDKTSRLAITAQAGLMYFGFVTGKMHVVEGLVLENFPEIQNYPKTELSKMVAAAIRSSTPIFVSQHLEITGNEWSYYFWNKGLSETPCEVEY